MKPPCEWFDWCHVKWNTRDPRTGHLTYTDYPCELKFFLHIPDGLVKTHLHFREEDHPRITAFPGPGMFAVVETIAQSVYNMMSVHDGASIFLSEGEKYVDDGDVHPSLYTLYRSITCLVV